ncbi:CYFA0S07e05028g1_1 [Cyberlindnera fabianii]|uniref:CYFA0S07e05028g1_1 n=1 Tax=Cyberlindnera fabianii TaxID=36022 RepID=A0A061AWU1_CYBFA|nr:CYFA0S07e05028g1_1 [Cyberlindnera fabianii]
MVKKEVSLQRLGTRDLLLLCQLLEQYGPSDLETIHSEFIKHPAFHLSHNELNQDELSITQRQLQQIIDDLVAEYPDMTIIQLCEHFYAKRIAELEKEISETQQKFSEVAATQKQS